MWAPFVGNTPMGLINDHDAYCVRLSRAGKLDQLATAGFFAKVGLTASSTTRDPLLQFGLGVPSVHSPIAYLRQDQMSIT